MVGIASTMTMRARVLRKVQIGTDDYGQPIYDEQIIATDAICRVWYGRSVREENDTSTIIVSESKAVFPTTTPVQQGDKLEEVTGRCGDVLYEKLLVDGKLMRRKTHYEAPLKHYE